MKVEELGCWSDALFLLESKGFSKDDAAELVLQIFSWGIRASLDRLRPSRPLPADLPQEVHDAAAQLTLLAETASPPAPAKPAKVRREPAKGLHRIPPDFALDDDLRCFAIERGFGAKAIEGMWLKFFNHYRAKGETAVDWRAKWRTWVMKTVEFNTRDGVSPNGGRPDGNFL